MLFQHCALFNLYKSDLPTVSLRPENLFVQTTPDIGSIRNNKTEITEAALTEQGPHIYSPEYFKRRRLQLNKERKKQSCYAFIEIIEWGDK